MKNFNLITFLFVALAFVLVQPAQAAVSVDHSSNEAVVVLKKDSEKMTKRDLRRQKRADRRKARMEKMMNKVFQKMDKFGAADIDLDDDTEKFLWYGIFAYAAGAVLWSLDWFLPGFGIFGWIGYLLMLGGTALIVVWLLKVFEVI
jgi:hypothetical protein